MIAEKISKLLPESLLTEIRARAGDYDRENNFFEADLRALQASGYLAAPAPAELGGAGLGLAELVDSQRLLAKYSPATALGVNMHLVWLQVSRFLHDRGISRLDWVFDDALKGEVFAFGISEAGNDAVLLDAKATATLTDEGDYLVSGMKIFTTLSPVWTRLGVHAKHAGQAETKEAGDGDTETVVFGFIRRDGSQVRSAAEGSVGLGQGDITHPGEWNPLGMRATQSWNTQLSGVRMLREDVAGSFAPYEPTDPIMLAIFSSFSILTAAVYAGIADRALELAGEAARRETTKMDGSVGSKLDDPEDATRLTRALLEHQASVDALTVLARDVDSLAQREDWFLALAAAKNRVTDEARDTVDVAMRTVGARGFQADSELARMYRDVLAGVFHPSSASSLARTVRGAFADPAQ